MKTREAFESIRHQKESIFSLRMRLTLTVTAELLLSILVSLTLWFLLDPHIPVDSTVVLIIALVVISLLIGLFVTSLLSAQFFAPIKKLGKAMEQVADGDFSVRLEDQSSSKEIMEVYSGFNLMAHELSATEILQTDFVSNVSHEFKTPINAIEGYATLLEGCDDLTAEQREYVEKIAFNTRRLSSLVGSILLLSKLENRQIPTGRSRYRLDEQIRQSIVALEPAWEPKEIEFDVEMERVEYLGNEAMMRHVWDNLISNAIKFNPHGGLVRIRLEKRGRQIRFTIDDCGPGISEEARKRIFDKFYQADNSHKAEGNGLGLALVKRILVFENGEINVENIPGGGCRFAVTLKTR